MLCGNPSVAPKSELLGLGIRRPWPLNMIRAIDGVEGTLQARCMSHRGVLKPIRTTAGQSVAGPNAWMIHLCHKYLLSIYYGLGTIVSSGDSCPSGADIQEGETDNIQDE